MPTNARMLLSLTAFFLCGPALHADDSKVGMQAKSAPAFEVNDLPKDEPIEGQLGGPGAPSLKEQQDHLAKAMLERGLCNVSYYGEEFCKKQETKSFKVTDHSNASTGKDSARD